MALRGCALYATLVACNAHRMVPSSVPAQPAPSTPTVATCRSCGREFTAMTEQQRVEHHAELWAVLRGDIDYRAYDPYRPPVSSERTAAYAIGAAIAYTRFLVAADQGLCIACAAYLERPAR
jgi:hypothetical protein